MLRAADRAKRKRKQHTAQKKTQRQIATAKNATKLADTKAADAKQDAANPQQQAFGKKGNRVPLLLFGSIDGASDCHAIAGSF